MNYDVKGEKRMKKKFISILVALSMLLFTTSSMAISVAEVGDSLKVGDYAESAAETQALIDARPDIQRPMENLNRGAVAVNVGEYVYIS